MLSSQQSRILIGASLGDGTTVTDTHLEKRLTCNRLFRHLIEYSQSGLTGQLLLCSDRAATSWWLYLVEGKLVWATGGQHPKRRWRRQLYLAAGMTPDFATIDTEAATWDYRELARLSHQTLTPPQVRRIIQGTLAEVLFDIVQALELPLSDRITPESPLLDLYALDRIEEGWSVEQRWGEALGESDLAWPSVEIPALSELQSSTQHIWKQWASLGLAAISPNAAPVILNSQPLQAKLSPKAFGNLGRLANGKRAFRDIAVKLKRCPDLIGGARVLMPFVGQKLLCWREIDDLVPLASAPYQQTFPPQPIAIVVDAPGERRRTLETLAAEAGYTVANNDSTLEAFYQLSRPREPRPNIILLCDRPQSLPPEELCSLLRRLEPLQSTAIVVYAKPHGDRLRQQTLLDAGADDYLDEGDRDRLCEWLSTSQHQNSVRRQQLEQSAARASLDN